MHTSVPSLDYLSAISDRLRGLGFTTEALQLEDCGRRMIRRKGKAQFKPMLCWRRYCPRCGVIRATRAKNRYAAKILQILGPGVAAYFLTLTPPFIQDDATLAGRIATGFRSFTNDSWWKGPKGAGKSVAVITVLEFGYSNGHPHLHVLVVGPAKEAEKVAIQLQMRWMSRHPAAHDGAQDFKGPISGPEDIQRCLAYLTKGCAIQAGWSDSAICGAMFMLTGKRKTLTAGGLGMRGKPPASHPTSNHSSEEDPSSAC